MPFDRKELEYLEEIFTFKELKNIISMHLRLCKDEKNYIKQINFKEGKTTISPVIDRETWERAQKILRTRSLKNSAHIRKEGVEKMDVVPRAYWAEYEGRDKGLHYCSQCEGQAFNYYDGELIEVLSPYCPHCGAMMDGEDGRCVSGSV